MADKWGGIKLWARELWENPCGLNAFEAELRRRVEPLLEAIEGAEKLLRAMGRSDTGKILKEYDSWKR